MKIKYQYVKYVNLVLCFPQISAVIQCENVSVQKPSLEETSHCCPFSLCREIGLVFTTSAVYCCARAPAPPPPNSSALTMGNVEHSDGIIVSFTGNAEAFGAHKVDFYTLWLLRNRFQRNERLVPF